MYNYLGMTFDNRTLDHEKLIRDGKAELYYTIKQRNALNERISQLNKILRGLAFTLPIKERDELLANLRLVARKPAGLTELIGEVLQKDNSEGMVVAEIREQLENSGFDLSDYSQPLATISNTLSRMRESGKVKRKLVRGKGLAWAWSSGSTPIDSLEIFRPEEPEV
jgi:hypothetical protein